MRQASLRNKQEAGAARGERAMWGEVQEAVKRGWQSGIIRTWLYFSDTGATAGFEAEKRLGDLTWVLGE